MAPITPRDGVPLELGRAARHGLTGWWRTVRLGAVLLALVLTPSSYTHSMRLAMARQIFLASRATLLWFIVLSTLISLVLIRIVVVTAVSYGLTQYALEMVVRVLVLELIPLTAALFAALHYAIPQGAELARIRMRGGTNLQGLPAIDALHREVLPHVVAAMFCTLMLAALSCVLTLILAYLSVYGATRWGFAGYTHVVGQIFNAPVTLIFALKIFFSSLAVAFIPVASALFDSPQARLRTGVELQSLLRLLMALLVIEAASLVGNYS